MAAGLESLDELDHLAHPLRGVRLGLDGAGVEGDHVAVEPGRLGRGQLTEVDAELAGLRQDGVVDVGDVAHEPHGVAEILEPADQQVVVDVGVGVAQMGRVVGRDAADVDRDHLARLERDDLGASGVVEAHGDTVAADRGGP